MSGYIKLHRSMLSWEWLTDPVTTQVWIYCLLRANYDTQRWRGEVIKPGQFVTTLRRMAEDLGLTVRSVRTALNHLKSTQEVTQQSAHNGTLITVEKWALYQSAGEKAAQQSAQVCASQRHTSDTRPTQIKEIIRNNNNINKERDIRERAEDEDLMLRQHAQFEAIKARLSGGEA